MIFLGRLKEPLLETHCGRKGLKMGQIGLNILVLSMEAWELPNWNNDQGVIFHGNYVPAP